jgi:hypothetical protein
MERKPLSSIWRPITGNPANGGGIFIHFEVAMGYALFQAIQWPMKRVAENSGEWRIILMTRKAGNILPV